MERFAVLIVSIPYEICKYVLCARHDSYQLSAVSKCHTFRALHVLSMVLKLEIQAVEKPPKCTIDRNVLLSPSHFLSPVPHLCLLGS